MQGNTYGHDPAFENNPYLTDYPSIGSGFSFSQPDPCDNPNPPAWCTEGGGGCNNPNHPEWCDGNHSVPIDLGPVGLVLSMAFGVLLLKLKL